MLLAMLQTCQLPPLVTIPQQLHNLNSLNTQRVRNSGLVEQCTHASIIWDTGGKGQSWAWAGESQNRSRCVHYTILHCLYYSLCREDILPLLSAALILDIHTVRAVYKCWERWKGRPMQYNTDRRVRILEMGL